MHLYGAYQSVPISLSQGAYAVTYGYVIRPFGQLKNLLHFGDILKALIQLHHCSLKFNSEGCKCPERGTSERDYIRT